MKEHSRTIILSLVLLALAPLLIAGSGGSDIIVYLGLGLTVLVVIFMLLREFFCWYWKINLIVSKMDRIISALEAQGRQSNSTSALGAASTVAQAKCASCGELVSAGEEFCGSCGKKVIG